jgi:tRNA dimethylallyltransferase
MAAGPKVVAVVGPTAVGKSTLALRLAVEHDGEIISADSRQVYRYMDIGTAKPTAAQRLAVPHHLVDIVDPDEEYSLAFFLRQALSVIQDVHSRDKLPIVVGGTGQYIWGLLEGWQVPEVPPSPALREDLQARASVDGGSALYEELARLDPAAAGRVDPQNTRRVIRALEVYYSSPGQGPSEPSRKAPAFRQLVLGLTLERAELYRRIDDRVDAMIEAGWVAEVKRLLSMGYGPDLPALSSLGYRELAQHLKEGLSLDDAVTRIKGRSRRFARQQRSWFRLGDERIRWSQGTSKGFNSAASQVTDFLTADQ